MSGRVVRDSAVLADRAVLRDVLRNESAMLFYDATLDVEFNESMEPFSVDEEVSA